MASDIFRKIVEQKIDIFASTIGDDATSIFTKDNKLFHALEYGMYKERAARELLSCTTNKHVGISDGFIITTNNTVSTQCDIIMYQNDTLPIIDNGIANFYPIEIVKGIGEVKSKLNITQFKKALLKMAKNKKMFLDRKGTSNTKEPKSKEFDEIYSFLICNKFDFDISTVNFDDIYADEPDLKVRHNMILSLEDGFCIYGMNPNHFLPKQKERYIENRGRLDINPIEWPYPHHTEDDETYKCITGFVPLDENDKYAHVIKFLINMRVLVGHQREYDLDILQYLRNDIVRIRELE